jgi:hypothetical protein
VAPLHDVAGAQPGRQVEQGDAPAAGLAGVDELALGILQRGGVEAEPRVVEGVAVRVAGARAQTVPKQGCSGGIGGPSVTASGGVGWSRSGRLTSAIGSKGKAWSQLSSAARAPGRDRKATKRWSESSATSSASISVGSKKWRRSVVAVASRPWREAGISAADSSRPAGVASRALPGISQASRSSALGRRYSEPHGASPSPHRRSASAVGFSGSGRSRRGGRRASAALRRPSRRGR